MRATMDEQTACCSHSHALFSHELLQPMIVRHQRVTSQSASCSSSRDHQINQSASSKPTDQPISTAVLPPSTLIILLLLLCLSLSPANCTTWGSYTVDRQGNNGGRNYRCYSCMSPEYQRSWTHLRHVYQHPKNFTERCHDLKDRVGTVDCHRDACVTLVEPIYLGGFVTGRMVMRGCFTSFYVGNNKLPSWLFNDNTRPDSKMCRKVSGRLLLPPKLRRNTATSNEKDWTVCVCFGDMCNYYPTGAAPSLNLSSLPLFILLLPLLASIFNLTSTSPVR